MTSASKGEMQEMRQPRKATRRRAAAAPPQATANGGALPEPGPPLAELPFDDAYRRFRMTSEEVHGDEDRRIEFWDGATETALEVREDISPYHERPVHLLAALAERIAAVRGKPIRCFGNMDLELPAKDDCPARILQADQSLYLYPDRANIVGPEAMVVGENHYPDIVLEVDRTTDIRRHKLKLYEAWRFPEVWVDVPEEAPNRRKPKGTTIYGLEGSKFKVLAASRAFPTWTAAEIHTALNEQRLSAETTAVLERIGRILGEREGTGPDDDLLMRSLRRQALASERAAMVRHLMVTRGMQAPDTLPIDALLLADLQDVMDAALGCADEADLVARLNAAADREPAKLSG